MKSLPQDHQMLAEDFERISEIQEEFMNEDEQKEIQMRVDNGELFWTGFTEFRDTEGLIKIGWKRVDHKM